MKFKKIVDDRDINMLCWPSGQNELTLCKMFDYVEGMRIVDKENMYKPTEKQNPSMINMLLLD